MAKKMEAKAKEKQEKKNVELDLSSNKKERKAALKKAKEMEFEAMMHEKVKIDEKIAELNRKRKETKDKKEKKAIKDDIKELKYQKNRIGRKDSFLGDVREEMHLVRWPSKAEVVKYSIACLIFVIFFALFFFGLTSLFAFVKGLVN